MTLVFQHGLLHGPLGFTPYGGIVPWMPLFMFVLLFGLSMDYQVFILSRIAELRRSGRSSRASIIDGISSSAGVVTSAAAIMVAVFSIFATLGEIEFKLFGVTMAAAVLIDATIVRGVLLPAGLSLLGDRAWRGAARVKPLIVRAIPRRYRCRPDGPASDSSPRAGRAARRACPGPDPPHGY